MQASLLLVYRILLSISLGLIFCVGVLAWRHRDTPGADALFVYAVGMAVWVVGQFGASIATTEAGTVGWLKLMWLGIVVVPTAALVFGLEYTGWERFVNRRIVAALSIEPAIAYGLVLTNERHGHIWSAIEPTAGAVSKFAFEHGAAYYVHLFYTYALVTILTLLILHLFVRSRDIHRGQATALFVGIMAPWISNIAFVTGLVAVDPTPLSFTVTAVALAVAFVRYRFADIVPVARDTIVDNMTDGIFVLDGTDRIVDANPNGMRLIGREDEPIVGRDGPSVLPPEMNEHVQTMMQGTDDVAIETDVGTRYLSMDVTPISDDRDRQVGRLLLVRDVTDERRYQRELERQNERLDRVASVVSHDLRNPLNVAHGYLEILEEETEDQNTERIGRALNRMDRMVADVLALARQGESIPDSKRDPVDIGALARESWKNVTTDEATLSVSVDHSVAADRSRLAHVFENLFRNAIEHGGSNVTVVVGSLESDSDARGFESVGFYVEDDGPGIPEKDHETVFEPGYTTIATGSGLGLDIVKSVVDAHGWDLSVTDGANDGARFEVRYEGAAIVDSERTT